MRRAPVQGTWHHDPTKRRVDGSISWEEHERAWQVYASKFGDDQSALRMAARAGFDYEELTRLLGHEPKTWTAEGWGAALRDAQLRER